MIRMLPVRSIGLMLLACGIAASPALAAPTLVRDADRPSADPVHGTCMAATYLLQSSKCILYTVPAGKRLVVETVTYNLYVSSVSALRVIFGQDSGKANLYTSDPNVFQLAPAITGVSQSAYSYGNSAAIRFYLDAGQSLAGQADLSGPDAGFSPDVFGFSGYLVER